MSLKKTTIAGAMFTTSIVVVMCTCYGAAESRGQQRDDETVAALKKRVAQLEAEVAKLRKAIQAGGGIVDPAAERKNIAQVANLRTADLLQRAQNTHAVLREVLNGKMAGPDLQNKINDLNNDLTALWSKMAAFGLGRDPYLDAIQVGNSGFTTPKAPPDHGIPGPYVAFGLPRLHERFLDAGGIKDPGAEKKNAEFMKLVKTYGNPAVYQHRAFGQRAYSEYRAGRNLFTPQYGADLIAVDQWLTDFESVLMRIPAYFDTKK